MGRAAQLGVLILALGCVGWSATTVGHAREYRPPSLRSGCEVDYAPLSIVRGEGEADGFSVELLEAALAAVGREAVFKTATWSEIRDDLAAGRLDVLPMVARTPERESVFDFTFPYLTMHGTIVVRSETADISGPEDLKGRRVAVLRDDVAHEYLREANLGAEIVPLPSFATAMRELSEGRYDAVVIQKLLAFELMRELGLDTLQTVGPPLDGYTQVLCFAVREGDAELLSLLNEGLSIVMADGTFRRLHAKWFADLETIELRRTRIVVGGDADYPPYEFLDAAGVPAGFVVDLTRAIARHMGLSVDIQLGSWREVRTALDHGRIDAIEGMYYTEERDRRFDFTTPHALVQHVAVVRRGVPEISDLEALAGMSVVAMDGDLMHDLLVQRRLEVDLTLVESQEEALHELAAGKHDAALVARLPALYWIERNGWDHLQVPTAPLLTAEYCYAVPHGGDVPLAAFAEGLATLRQTGEFREIQNRWLAPYDDDSGELAAVARYVLIGLAPLAFLLALSVLWSRSLGATVRRRTLELQYANDAFRDALEEKSVLLREVHHRVKNNLQVISSLVNLQAEGVSDPVLRKVFDDVRDRVRSMALVHEFLYQSTSLAEVDFADYVRVLLEQLLRSHSAAPGEVVLQLDTQPVGLNVEVAVPCGLILNELAGNALKHAFVGRSGGHLSVSLEAPPGGGFRLAVGDDGLGLPETLDWRSTPTLGLRLVQMLAEQIGATVELTTAPGEGTRVTIDVGDRGHGTDAASRRGSTAPAPTPEADR